jgi:hypothetical protein
VLLEAANLGRFAIDLGEWIAGGPCNVQAELTASRRRLAIRAARARRTGQPFYRLQDFVEQNVCALNRTPAPNPGNDLGQRFGRDRFGNSL